nr:hypothetical protein [Psychrobacter sp. PraFG1]UNK04507.1 hypothetical protein MN210_09430 [Psychrobacter sp. PraFG1]
MIHGEDSQISQPIHEIEFELIEGDVHFYLKRLRRGADATTCAYQR